MRRVVGRPLERRVAAGELTLPEAMIESAMSHIRILEELNFDLLSLIFEDMVKKAKPEDMVNVNMSRRFANGCQEPVWQGIASSGTHSLTITYSIDGKQTDIQEFSF